MPRSKCELGQYFDLWQSSYEIPISFICCLMVISKQANKQTKMVVNITSSLHQNVYLRALLC